MSVQAIAWVLQHSDARGLDRLVLISLANHAIPTAGDGDVHESWPGLDTIAAEAGLEDRAAARRALDRLMAAGEIEPIPSVGPIRLVYRIFTNRRPRSKGRS
jgi:hypothetical protein